MTTTIERAIHALENNVGEMRVEGALNILRAALAAPAAAPSAKAKKPRLNSAAFMTALVAAANARKMTMRDVSMATGVNETTLSRMKGGERACDAASFSALATWAGLNPQDFYLPSTAPATAPESGVMTEIDYNDDDALRFVQRVLESDAPLSDIRDARNMVVEIRTRVLKARASKPATAPEPICTKCGDVITAHDPGLCGCCLSTRDATSPEQKDRPINCGTGHCSCIECAMPGGPLLKDKP